MGCKMRQKLRKERVLAQGFKALFASGDADDASKKIRSKNAEEVGGFVDDLVGLECHAERTT